MPCHLDERHLNVYVDGSSYLSAALAERGLPSSPTGSTAIRVKRTLRPSGLHRGDEHEIVI
jgi:hypothetical protein